MPIELELKRRVQLYGTEKSAWHFIVLPKNVSKDLKQMFQGMTGGFGSLPVEVTIGKTVWRTSIFYSAKDKAFLLPIKAMVRKNENISIGKTVSFTMKILI
ncbi:MAG: hypothetical protein ACD_5C00354G0010 [uncultured bacterium]|nr:MAG: hypothetical protein ACD_5C00354G0010 [uncultured bacterium]